MDVSVRCSSDMVSSCRFVHTTQIYILMICLCAHRWWWSRVWWAGGGPQLREEEAGAWPDTDLAGSQRRVYICVGSKACLCFHRSQCLCDSSSQDVQLKVKAYILGTDMSNFKYDDFIVVLDVISRYDSRPEEPARSSLVVTTSHLLVLFFYTQSLSSFLCVQSLSGWNYVNNSSGFSPSSTFIQWKGSPWPTSQIIPVWST